MSGRRLGGMLGDVDGRRGTTWPMRGHVEVALHDPEQLARLYAAAMSLSSARTISAVVRWLVRYACSLAHAERATFTFARPDPAVGEVVWAGPGGAGAVALERELEVADRPYGVLRLSTVRPRLTAGEEAAVELLCIHAALALERVTLRQHEDVVRRVRMLVGGDESATVDTVRRVGDVRVDLVRHQAFVGDSPVQLTPSEFRVLELLTEEPERVYSRDEIVARLWGTAEVGSSRVADVHVTRLRRKLDLDGHGSRRLQAIRGVGYKVVPVAPAGQPL